MQYPTQWKTITSHPTYAVSNIADVLNAASNTVLKKGSHPRGYLTVKLK
ncbi:hypothetical protein GCM10007916_30770 [Psychromonas marina]|uniref:Uncharacterized protein n=1 Tax=Psychromonas marina TaxID=88364 RepID=A0ABQ6E3T1_9GAMM|nr:hypothetical protein [Psychromonas marina]GLS92007.1 hypothetical protein GCM10007916_30770 [Psychromonas marina]